MIQWLSVVVTVFMMMGFDNIPSHVLNQEKTRHQLFIACAKALKSVDEDSNYKDVDLTVCNDHQLLAKSMMADIKASSKDHSLDTDGQIIIRKMANDIIDINVKWCYAKVKRGDQLRDHQGRIGIAACDRMTEDQRHRLILQAIEQAKLEALIEARLEADMRRP